MDSFGILTYAKRLKLHGVLKFLCLVVCVCNILSKNKTKELLLLSAWLKILYAPMIPLGLFFLFYYYFIMEWANKIFQFFRERIKKPTWETPIPDSHKLTEEDITNFVESLKPTVLRAMFSKMNMSDVSSAVKHLSILRPELIVPAVIDR